MNKLEYICEHGINFLKVNGLTFSVENSFSGQTKIHQDKNVRKMLSEKFETPLHATYQNNNGISSFSIIDGLFSLVGESSIYLEVPYVENKNEINNFLNYMLSDDAVDSECVTPIVDISSA